VLVAGSDMEEPVADMVRGALDGHVILDRAIADRGRYPAINILRSVSRSLPGAATSEENTILQEVRGLLADYEKSELILRAGLYTRGADINTDRAIDLWPAIDRFLMLVGNEAPEDRFAQLRNILRSEAKRA
jgi:flagellum-specific ATP synthase